MATVRKVAVVDADPDDVWDALRDWAAPHERLVPGFVVDTRLDGPDRVVTFFNGATVRELFVDCDERARRLVWSVVDGPYTHHNASAQVFADGDRTRFEWIADVLPHDARDRLDQLMQRGTDVLKRTLEDHAAHPAGGQ
jgi:hypothetical protein